MFPVLTGVLPFGLVMGTLANEAGASFTQSTFMNFLCYAGTSQIAAIDLMVSHTPVAVIVITALIINLRFLLYSAAMAPHLRAESAWKKTICAYFLTDQAYTLMAANEDRLKPGRETVQFYFGASVCMAIGWHLSTALGFAFGNFAPKEWSLDFGVALSFVVLLAPTLKNRLHIYVAVFSSIAGILLKTLPFRLGIVVSVALAMSFAALLLRRKRTL